MRTKLAPDGLADGKTEWVLIGVVRPGVVTVKRTGWPVGEASGAGGGLPDVEEVLTAGAVGAGVEVNVRFGF